jgi:biopolymer transport protein ExbD
MSFGFATDAPAHAHPLAEINIIPLVDVMLVLVVIFIITAPLFTEAVRVDLPRTTAVPARPPAEAVRLALDGDGVPHWEGERLNDGDLPGRLAEVAARQPQPELHLSADRHTPYERIAEVMAAAQAAGVGKMGFVTLPSQP